MTGAGRAPVLVTGATGFVGGAVVRHLRERGCPVRVLVRDKARAARNDWLGPPVSVCVGDILDPASLRQAMEGCCLVLNCAGLNSFWERDRRAYDRINVEGTRTVVCAALEAGVPKVVHVSTVMAYGFPPRMRFSADSPVGPHMSGYARSKHEGDEAARELHRSRGLPLVVVSLAAVLGKGDRKDVMQVKPFVEGRVPVMINSRNVFTYVDIDDAAEAIVRAGFAPGNAGSRYLVGAHRMTTEQYFGIISEISGMPMPRLRMGRMAAMALARLLAAWAALTGRPPLMPLDLMRTVFHGSLLFDGETAAAQLGLEYTPIRKTLAAAVADARGR